MKANLFIALVAMTTLGLTEQGFIKLACWGVLIINFFFLVRRFEEDLR